jgi:hypothetical protein
LGDNTKVDVSEDKNQNKLIRPAGEKKAKIRSSMLLKMLQRLSSSRIVVLLYTFLFLLSSSSLFITTTIHAQESALQDLYSCDDPNDPNNLIPCDVDTSLWDLDSLRADQSPDTSQVCIELIQILVDAAAAQQQQQGDADNENDAGSTMFDEILSTVVIDALEPCVLWAMEYGELRQDGNGDENSDSQNNSSNQQQDGQDDAAVDGGKTHQRICVSKQYRHNKRHIFVVLLGVCVYFARLLDELSLTL